MQHPAYRGICGVVQKPVMGVDMTGCANAQAKIWQTDRSERNVIISTAAKQKGGVRHGCSARIFTGIVCESRA